ncbi:MAG: DUF5330 domain-containing protein [Pseudomonadota bacterium]
MFILRAAFWIAVVLAFLPVDRSGDEDSLKVSVGSALVAAQATVADVMGFCSRNPHVCDVGRDVGSVLITRAETGARALYDMTRNSGTEATTTDAPAVMPVKTVVPQSVRTIDISTDTLTEADTGPAWTLADQG